MALTWLRHLLTRAAEPDTPTSAPAHGDGGANLLSGSPSAAWFAGAHPSFFGENLSGVVAAVSLISRSIGSLPWLVYRTTDAGRAEVDSHPVVELLKRPDGPDGILTLADFGEFLVSQTLLFGNALAAIKDDQRGAPTRLLPIPWSCANPTISNSGRVVFNVAGADLPWWPPGRSTTIPSSDVLWLRDRADHAVYGRSVLSRAPSVLRIAMQSQAFAEMTFTNGAKLTGALEHPGRLSAESGNRIAQSWHDAHGGPVNAGKVVVLEEGMKFSPYSMTLEDAELLATRKFEVEEIARLFLIPLPLLNVWDHSTFTNSDTASQWFGQLTLAPLCRKIELEFSRVLFNDPSYSLEIDLSALMRGNFASRIQTEIAMVRAGVLTANEVRLSEGWSALPGGDKLQPQAVGGRPTDSLDDSLPTPDAPINGTGRNRGPPGPAR